MLFLWLNVSLIDQRYHRYYSDISSGGNSSLVISHEEMATSKSMFSEPVAVLSAKGVDISRTYGHLYILNPNNLHQYQCKLCLRVASLLQGSKDPRAPEAIKSLKAYLNCTSRSHIVAHIAIKHPEHLVDDFPSYCDDHLIRKAFHKDEASSVTPIPINELFNSPVIVDKLDFTLWLLEDMRPFSIVEGAGFKKLIDSLNKMLKNNKIKLPSADTIAREAAIVDEALQDVLRREIPSQVGHSEIEGSIIPTDTPFTLLSFTLDAWTSITGKPFFGLTMHYITDDFEMKSHAMALRHFSPPHTSSAYKQLFEAILDEYGLGTHTALSVTTDSASVMQKMMDETDLPHSRCMAHCINLAIQADTFDKPQFKFLIENPIKLAGFFTSSASTRNHIVEEKAKEMGIELVKAVQMVVTRWSSIYHMLKAHLKRLPVIITLSGKRLNIEPRAKQDEFDRLLSLCINQGSIHAAIVEILDPIAKWTSLLQSSTLPTISLIFEARSDILVHLQPRATDGTTEKKFRAHLKAAIENRFDEFFVPINLPAQVPQTDPKFRDVEKIRTRWQMTNCAALLDIRTAYQHILTSPMQHVGNRDTLIKYIASCIHTWKPGVKNSTTTTTTNTSSLGIGIWEDPKKDSSMETLIPIIRDEVASYVRRVVSLNIPSGSEFPVAIPLVDRLNRNPLTFWKECKSEFPNLSKVARSILAIQATSAASERIFSNAGFIGNPRRNRLSVDSLEICTLVRDALAQNIDLKQRVKEIWKRKNDKAKERRLETRQNKIENGSAKKNRREDAPVDDLSYSSGNDDGDNIDLTLEDEANTVPEIITNDQLRRRKLLSTLLADEADDIVEEAEDEGILGKPGAKIIPDDEETIKPFELDEDFSE